MERPKLKFGILSTARINDNALLTPRKYLPYIEVVAVASRDLMTAKKYAKKHKIPKFYGSYAELLADPEIQVIYNPLPNSMHAEWTIKALQAGKHVLCEKPFSSNTKEALEMKEATLKTNKILIEAFHTRYHPYSQRLRAIIASGEIGEIKKIHVSFLGNGHKDPKNIRYNYKLAGGSVMDMGCYTISMIRKLVGNEPTIMKVQAEMAFDQIDSFMHAEMSFPGGTQGTIECSLLNHRGSKILIEGTKGTISGNEPFSSTGYEFEVALENTYPRIENLRTPSEKTTYYFQLQALYNGIMNGTPLETNPDDAIGNMRVIDAIYKKAGLKIRGT